MAISIINIIKNSLKFSGVKAISALIGVPVTIYVATILVPKEYGTYGFLSLWLMYAGLIGPGIITAGSREIPVFLGRNKDQKALAVQNISVSSELLYTIIPFVVILGASFFYTDPILKMGLIIVSVSYAATRLKELWSRMNFIREKFNTVAKGNLIAAIAQPIVILVSVHWLKVYALIIGPFIACVISWVYFLRKGQINYHFRFDRSEALRLVKIGIVMQGLTIALWAFRLADRTIIASTLPLEQLGLYTYAIAFLMYALTLPTDFGNVLQPILWREAAKADSIFEGFKDVKRIAVYFALGAAIIIPVAQLGFYLIVSLITKNYIGSIPIFYVLSYNLFLASMGIIPNITLYSSMVNKQNIPLFCYSIGLALNIIFDLLVIKLGYGVVGVAWVTICTQGLVTFTLYYFIKGYVFKSTKEFLRFQVTILAPFFVCISFYFLHNYLGNLVNPWLFIAISLAAQIIVWGVVIGIFYRHYLSRNDIKTILGEIKAAVSGIRDRLPPRKSV